MAAAAALTLRSARARGATGLGLGLRQRWLPARVAWPAAGCRCQVPHGRVASSVVIADSPGEELDLGALLGGGGANGAATSASRQRPKTKRGSSLPEPILQRYPLPKEYQALVKRIEGGQQDPETQQKLWVEARKLAADRLEAQGDGSEGDWRQAVVRLRESLWLEELGIKMELRRWSFVTDSIFHQGGDQGDLFSLDVSELTDQGGFSLESLETAVTGARVVVSHDRGKLEGIVQPSSGGEIVAATTESSMPVPAFREAYPGPYRVAFEPVRFSFVAMHRALASRAAEELYSAGTPTPEECAVGDARGTNAALPEGLNGGQQRVVRVAANWTSRHPLVVWGPPGTGKSTVNAFLVWYLVQQRPRDLHILVATPSNTAADVLCEKLAKAGLSEKQMFRLNANGRSVATVPEAIRRFSRTASVARGREACPCCLFRFP